MQRIANLIGWPLAAALAAYACRLVVQHPTPIDQALPFIAVLATVIAWASHPALMVAVPLLMAGEIAIPDERMRLLWFGLVLGMECGGLSRRFPGGSAAAALQTVAIIALLRWIPTDNVLWPRELLLAAIAVAIVLALHKTPFAVAVGVLTAFLTPAIPLRTLAIPIVVLLIAIILRPRIELPILSAIAISIPVLFFAWSGVAARGFPLLLERWRPPAPRMPVNVALAAGTSWDIPVPDDARALIVSGANVPRLRRGALLGRIEPGGAEIRVGDASDWGFLRREHWYKARNPLPRDPAGTIRGYGYAAWVDASGRVALPRGARTIRVTADPGLAANASLQVEALELERR